MDVPRVGLDLTASCPAKLGLPSCGQGLVSPKASPLGSGMKPCRKWEFHQCGFALRLVLCWSCAPRLDSLVGAGKALYLGDSACVEGQIPGCFSAPQAFQDDLGRLKTRCGVGISHHPFCNKPCSSCAQLPFGLWSIPPAISLPCKALVKPPMGSQAVSNCIPRQDGWKWLLEREIICTWQLMHPQITPWLQVSQLEVVE